MLEETEYDDVTALAGVLIGVEYEGAEEVEATTASAEVVDSAAEAVYASVVSAAEVVAGFAEVDGLAVAVVDGAT